MANVVESLAQMEVEPQPKKVTPMPVRPMSIIPNLVEAWTGTMEEDEELEAETNDFVRMLRNSYNYASWTLSTNFRIAFSATQGRYIIVKKSLIFRMITCFLHICLITKELYTQRRSWRALRKNPGELVLYFDLVTGAILSTFMLPMPIYSWINRRKLANFLEELQTNPGLKVVARQHPWVKLFLMGHMTASVIAALAWSCNCLGLTSFMDFREMYEVSDAFVLDIYGDTGHGVLNKTLRIHYIIIQFYSILVLHMSCVNNVIQACYSKHITKDFVSAIRTGQYSAKQMNMLCRHLKSISREMNDLYALEMVLLVLMSVTFYSIHLVGIFNVARVNLHWRITMIFYCAELYYFYKASADGNVASWKVTRILRGKFLLTLPYSQLRSILYDLEREEFGIRFGKFFTLTPSFVGKQLNCLLMYALLNMSRYV